MALVPFIAGVVVVDIIMTTSFYFFVSMRSFSLVPHCEARKKAKQEGRVMNTGRRGGRRSSSSSASAGALSPRCARGGLALMTTGYNASETRFRRQRPKVHYDAQLYNSMSVNAGRNISLCNKLISGLTHAKQSSYVLHSLHLCQASVRIDVTRPRAADHCR